MRKKSIRKTIIISTSVFTILIGLIIFAGSYYFYARYVENSVTESAQTNLRFLADYIDNELDDVDQLVAYCRTSSAIEAFISSDNASISTRSDAYDALSEYVGNNAASKYLQRVVVTNLSQSYVQVVGAHYSTTINIGQQLFNEDFYPRLTSPDYHDYQIGMLVDPFAPRSNITVVPLLKPINFKYNSDLGGYVFIELKEDLFLDSFANSYHEDMGQLILNMGDNSYIYDGNTFTPLTKDWVADDYKLVSQPLSKEGLSVSLAIPLRAAAATRYMFLGLLATLTVMLVILTTFLNSVLDRAVTRPVKSLQRKMREISEGDFSRDPGIEWEHELGDIGRGVNDLAESVSNLIDTRISDEKQKKDLEYKVLQSQINPHFLYNTLNSIKWMATAQGAKGISDMTTALARLLKSISKGTSLLIPLSEELNLIQDYFTIQKYRYGGTISLVLDVADEDLLKYTIIKFTLQPLVENAIFHGIEPTGASGTITICARDEGEDLLISVTDDGVGMTEEQAARLLSDGSDSSTEFFKEIGVSNVHQRLKYEYGNDYGIRVDSQVGEYTTMTVIIPKKEDIKYV